MLARSRLLPRPQAQLSSPRVPGYTPGPFLPWLFAVLWARGSPVAQPGPLWLLSACAFCQPCSPRDLSPVRLLIGLDLTPRLSSLLATLLALLTCLGLDHLIPGTCAVAMCVPWMGARLSPSPNRTGESPFKCLAL